jgi:hypothetical protein
LGEKTASGVEKQLLQDLAKRVKNWQNVPPWYSAKKHQSRGTEGILNALVLANHDAEQGKKKIGDTTAVAFRHLWQSQLKEGDAKGSWPWLDFGLDPWESPGAAYYGTALAALAVGTAPGNFVTKAEHRTNIKMMRTYLATQYRHQNLHNRIVLLWASRRWTDLLVAKDRKKLIDEILSKQRADGGWSLSSLGKWQVSLPASDGYATGLIVFVLRQAGLKKDHPKVKNGMAWLLKNQNVKKGSWPARSVNREQRDQGLMARQFMADAATAYAVLALTM